MASTRFQFHLLSQIFTIWRSGTRKYWINLHAHTYGWKIQLPTHRLDWQTTEEVRICTRGSLAKLAPFCSSFLWQIESSVAKEWKCAARCSDAWTRGSSFSVAQKTCWAFTMSRAASFLYQYFFEQQQAEAEASDWQRNLFNHRTPFSPFFFLNGKTTATLCF